MKTVEQFIDVPGGRIFAKTWTREDIARSIPIRWVLVVCALGLDGTERVRARGLSDRGND